MVLRLPIELLLVWMELDGRLFHRAVMAMVRPNAHSRIMILLTELRNWNGINVVQGGQCVYVMLHAIFPSIVRIRHTMGPGSALD